jgi:phospholipase C
LGQLSSTFFHGVFEPKYYLNNLNSSSITAKLDPAQPYPLIVTIDFDTSQKCGIIGSDASTAYFKTFRIGLKFSLTVAKGMIDFVSWAVDSSVNLDDVIDIDLVTDMRSDPGKQIRLGIQGQIADAIRTPDHLTGRTGRDAINEMINSWLLGGAAANDPDASPANYNNVTSVGWSSDLTELQVTYSGPSATFKFLDEPDDWPAGVNFEPGLLTNIDHIIVLMMENRSFDHMLGYLSLPPALGGLGRTDVDGLQGTEINHLDDGTPCPVKPLASGETVFAPDPPHSFGPVQSAINKGAMDGFAQSYAADSGKAVGPNIMKYHTAATIPVYDTLARDFAICQSWFAAHPGPTFCNRFSTISGRLNIDPNGFWELSNSEHLRPAFAPTIFDALNDQSLNGGPAVTWKYFEHYYCYLRLFQAFTFNTENIFDFNDPGLGFVNVAATGNLPNVTFIDPHFIELPPDGNCDGPPADVAQGQKLVQQIVDAVISSPNWGKTMLIITYDEHGGFFDHVKPPAALPVAPGLPATYGVRVPAFVISPWVATGSVFGNNGSSGSASLYFDHASIMRTIANRFLKSPPYFGARLAVANDLSSIMMSQPRQSALLPFIPYNITYGASKKQLEAQGGIKPGAPVVQNDADGQDAQRFCFEDAGNGAFRIRTRSGSLYLTADGTGVPAGLPVPVKLDVRYPDSGGAAQLWSLRLFPLFVGRSAVQATISNSAFSGMLLHPSGDSTASGSALVLETLTTGFTFLHSPYEWLVSSPLIPGPGSAGGDPGNTAFTITPTALSFPTNHVGTISGQQQFVISTSHAFTINGVAIKNSSGVDSTDFTSVPKPGSPPPGAPVTSENNSVTVYVWFTPQTQGAISAQIEISHNLSAQPLVIPLSGTGDAAPAPLIAVSPTSLSFDPKRLTNHTVTVSNYGTAPLIIGSIAVSGNPSNYSVINACGAPGTLQPGQSCTVTVTSQFQGSGDSSLLVITHNAFGSPTEIGLESTGRGRPPR